MKRHVLALDQGTSSSRAVVFDAHGRIVSLANRALSARYPQPGWVEQDALEILGTQREAMREALSKAGIGAADLAAVGITNQRETVCLWQRDGGEPVAPAIVWQDRRTAERCAALRERGLESFVQQRTGLVLDPYFSATKLGWLLDNVDAARERAARGELLFGTVDSWLVYKLSAGRLHLTDRSNASRTLLYSLKTGDWDDELLRLFDIPRACLPRIVASCLTEPPSLDIDGVAVPLGGLAGDQQAALFGQGCFSSGMAKNTYGTGCFMLLNVGSMPRASAHRLLATEACARHGRVFALEGSVFVGGAVVQWLRDGLGIIQSAAEIEALARGVPDSGGVTFVPAFTGLGSPHWDPRARGTLLGLTRGTTRGHIARAALEAIALQCAEVLNVMQADSGSVLTELRVDGGATVNDLLMQMQADLLGVAVLRPKVTESTAQGAAWLAGLAVGFWSSSESLAGHWQLDRRFEPTLSPARAQALRERWAEAVARSRDWAGDAG